MTDKELWDKYTEEYPLMRGVSYDAWQYGSNDPDALLRLTLSGVKTATASAYELYIRENSPVPQAGTHSVILDSNNDAACIIKDVRVYCVPFDEVDADQAYKEGEDDRSLEYWRRVHEYCFRMDLESIGEKFSEKMMVVCEQFEVVYRASDVR